MNKLSNNLSSIAFNVYLNSFDISQHERRSQPEKPVWALKNYW